MSDLVRIGAGSFRFIGRFETAAALSNGAVQAMGERVVWQGAHDISFTAV